MVFLERNKIHCLGTARGDRLRNEKLPSTDQIQDKPRGYCAETCLKADVVHVSCVLWKYIKSVLLLSTFVRSHPLTEVQRYNKNCKVYETVDCPHVVLEYNKHMGGVDKINSIIRRYKIKMWTKKLYLRIFYHLLGVTLCNSWLLYVRASKAKQDTEIMPLAEFREEDAITMCKLGEKTTPKRGRPSTELETEISMKGRKPNVLYIPPKEVRKDETGHWPLWTNTRQRCKLPNYAGKSFITCEKCKLNFCLNKDKNCFKNFHSQ